MKTESQISKQIFKTISFKRMRVYCFKSWQLLSWLEVISWKSSPTYVSGGLYCACWPLVHWVCTGPGGKHSKLMSPTMQPCSVLPPCTIVTFVMLIDTKSPICDSSVVGDRPALLCCFDAIAWGLFQALWSWSPPRPFTFWLCAWRAQPCHSISPACFCINLCMLQFRAWNLHYTSMQFTVCKMASLHSSLCINESSTLHAFSKQLSCV